MPYKHTRMLLNDTTPPVAWDEQGHPFSPRFGDRYRSEGMDGRGGLAQARHVFLAGCGLCESGGMPAASPVWGSLPAWRILENGFGLGLNFLATWQLWLLDPQRPATLRYDATEAYPPSAGDVLRGAQAFPELQPLAQALAGRWTELLRTGELAFEQDAIRLRLHVGEALPALESLASEATAAPVDSVFLDGFDPKLNPAMWSSRIMKAVGRLARPGTHASTWCVARSVRDALTDAGFLVSRRAGLPPKRHCLAAVWQPPQAGGA